MSASLEKDHSHPAKCLRGGTWASPGAVPGSQAHHWEQSLPSTVSRLRECMNEWVFECVSASSPSSPNSIVSSSHKARAALGRLLGTTPLGEYGTPQGDSLSPLKTGCLSIPLVFISPSCLSPLASAQPQETRGQERREEGREKERGEQQKGK